MAYPNSFDIHIDDSILRCENIEENKYNCDFVSKSIETNELQISGSILEEEWREREEKNKIRRENNENRKKCTKNCMEELKRKCPDFVPDDFCHKSSFLACEPPCWLYHCTKDTYGCDER